MQPIVSIIIPSYNSAKYIQQTLKYLHNQKLKDIEMIIVDDQSNDNTCDTVIAFDDQRISCYRLKERHGGPSLPRNLGVEISKAPYVGFCDSDDLMLPHILSEAVSFLEAHSELGMCFWNAIKFDNQTGAEQSPFLKNYHYFRNIPKTKIGQNWFSIKSPLAYFGLFYENFILTPGCVVVPRHIFEKVGNFDINLRNADDWDMWLRISMEYPIGFIDDIGLKYRVRNASVSARGASLYYNRNKVLKKHLLKRNPDKVVQQINKSIEENLYCAGYAYQNSLKFAKAREAFLKSLSIRLSLKSLKGLLLTFLPIRLYRKLKQLQKNMLAYI